MFTLLQIEKAHAKVRSGADFPQYIQDLKALGVLKYIVYVCDGHAEYIGENNYRVISTAEYFLLEISEEISIDKFIHSLKMHQQGKSNYHTFCKNSADAGVDKWIVDIEEMSCTYFGKLDRFIFEEKISI